MGSNPHTHDVVTCSFAVDIFFDNSFWTRFKKYLRATNIHWKPTTPGRVYLYIIYPIWAQSIPILIASTPPTRLSADVQHFHEYQGEKRDEDGRNKERRLLCPCYQGRGQELWDVTFLICCPLGYVRMIQRYNLCVLSRLTPLPATAAPEDHLLTGGQRWSEGRDEGRNQGWRSERWVEEREAGDTVSICILWLGWLVEIWNLGGFNMV